MLRRIQSNARDIAFARSALDAFYDTRRDLLARGAASGIEPAALADAAGISVEAVGAIRRRAAAKSKG